MTDKNAATAEAGNNTPTNAKDAELTRKVRDGDIVWNTLTDAQRKKIDWELVYDANFLSADPSYENKDTELVSFEVSFGPMLNMLREFQNEKKHDDIVETLYKAIHDSGDMKQELLDKCEAWGIKLPDWVTK